MVAKQQVTTPNSWAIIMKRAYINGYIDEFGLEKVKTKRLSKDERDEILLIKKDHKMK
jgi:hypothetical protein